MRLFAALFALGLAACAAEDDDPHCGDGTLVGSESCDDGNTVDGDGCSHRCEIEAGFTCRGAPSICEARCTADSQCDDGRFCNGRERCDITLGCLPGVAPGIDDSVDCTVDTCNESRDIVVHTPDGSACDDGDACTSDLCVPSLGCTHPVICACVVDPDCDDGNACTLDTCDAGQCVYVNSTAGCDDGIFCNGVDTCSGGTCTHSGDPCAGGAFCADACNESADTCNRAAQTVCDDDGNGCTDDVCDGKGACGHPPNTVACDDGLFCNGVDTCSGGVCAHSGDPCAGGAFCANACNESADTCNRAAQTVCDDDGNSCTDDVCDGKGACSHPPNTVACDDGLFCNGVDTCSGGVCTHSGDPCAGGAFCANACSESAHSCNRAAGTVCASDGDSCTSSDRCDGAGACRGVAYSCDDGVPCTIDQCDGSGGCTFTPSLCVPDVLEQASVVAGVQDSCTQHYSPAIVEHPAGFFHMWTGGWRDCSEYGNDKIYHATSTDMATWTFDNDPVIADPATSGCGSFSDAWHFNDPSVVLWPGSPPVFLMYVTGCEDSPTCLSEGGNKTYGATSFDGVTWSWPPDNPVVGTNNGLDPTGGAWAPSAVVVGSQIYLYYHTQKLSGGPVNGAVRLSIIEPGGPGGFFNPIGSPEPILPGFHVNVDVVRTPTGLFELLYDSGTPFSIRRLVSIDGRHFNPDPTFTPLAASSAHLTGHTGIVDGSSYWVFFGFGSTVTPGCGDGHVLSVHSRRFSRAVDR